MGAFDSFKKLEDITAENTQRKEPTATEANQFYSPESDKKPETIPAQPNAAQPSPTQPALQPMKMDKERAQKSGRANAYIAGGVIENLFKCMETIRFSMKFSSADKRKLLTLRLKDKNLLTENEKQLQQNFLMLVEEHKEKEAKIPLTDRDKEALDYAYTLYAEITGKETDPALIKGAAILNLILSRALDIYT